MTESEALEIDIMFIQVKEIFKYIDKTLFEKTPLKIRNFITSYNGISNYSFKYDINKKLAEQQISSQTKSFIALLDYNYWASEEDKKIIEKAWNKNESSADETVDDLFKNNSSSNVSKVTVQAGISSQSINQAEVSQPNNENTFLVVKKESFFTKLLNFIKSIFKKEKSK